METKAKSTLFSLLLLSVLQAVSCSEAARTAVVADGEQYDHFFTGERLRVDVVFCGDAEGQSVSLDAIYREPEWSGAPSNIIDKFGYGDYRLELFAGDTLVYSSGFNTLFEEWRTTAEASDRPRCAGQALLMPFPKRCVELRLSERIRATGEYSGIFNCLIDPEDRHIISGPQNSWVVKLLQDNGPSREKVDVAILAEGYSSGSMSAFREDASRLVEYFFTMEPYASRKSDFNVWLVETESEDDGVDVPQEGIWKRTLFDSMFDTFYEDRYLTIMDHRKIASAASSVPYDALIVIANDAKYGGGGFYNSYAIGTAGNERSFPVYIHEFGHSFAGLGDEYYDSSTPYDDFYPVSVEPWEPNITTMVDFCSKWEDMVESSTPVPTPADSLYYGVTGVFEGAGYMAHGCFRPYFECRMLNNTAPCFCPVCRRAIDRMIDFYCGRP